LRPVRISRVQASTLTFIRCFDNIGNNIDNACEKPVLFSPELFGGGGDLAQLGITAEKTISEAVACCVCLVSCR